MPDLERLDEALRWSELAVPGGHMDTLAAAARAYRDLLVNGERVEPDYLAAKQLLIDRFGHQLPYVLHAAWEKVAHHIVDAAIGDKLLVDPPAEEE